MEYFVLVKQDRHAYPGFRKITSGTRKWAQQLKALLCIHEDFRNLDPSTTFTSWVVPRMMETKGSMELAGF